MVISKKTMIFKVSMQRGANIFHGGSIFPGGGGDPIAYSYRNL